jgi:hypothetical protein
LGLWIFAVIHAVFSANPTRSPRLLSRFRTIALSQSLLIAAASPALAAGTASLRGSPASMERQHEVAQEQDYSFLRTPAEVLELREEGGLVAIPGNADYELARVSYPFARPEVKLFIERLAGQYRAGCGEALVVTSLTRPLSSQPRNAHALSVHPAGMAVDFRIPREPECREWLEGALLSLEGQELLDVTRERSPAHYHVAVFPAAYMAYVAKLEEAAAAAVAAERGSEPAAAAPAERRDPDGFARFALVVALSIAVIFALGRQGAQRRQTG